MSTVTLFTRKDKLKQDDGLHRPILDAVVLHKTPAYTFANKRMVALGLSKEEAEKIIKG